MSEPMGPFYIVSPQDMPRLRSRRVPFKNGLMWISDAWYLYKQSPVVWSGLMVSVFLILALVQLVPLIGWLAVNLAWPGLMAGMMFGAFKQAQGQELLVNHLFAGFKHRPHSLIGLGGAYVALSIGVLLVMAGVAWLLGLDIIKTLFSGASEPVLRSGGHPDVIAAVLLLLCVLGLSVPLAMATLFAPALILIGGKGVYGALMMSFTGCLKNILPFLLYGIVMFALAIAASIPLLLGWIVLQPMLITSVYAAYHNIYYLCEPDD